MTHTIHKFIIDAPSKFVEIDPRAQFIHVALQRGVPHVWAIVDPEAEKETILLEVFGTGHPGIDYHKHIYVGTWQEEALGLVWHLFRGTSNGPTP